MHKEGPEVMMFMVEFSRSLDIRAGKQSLRESGESA
jgi:hypothetical protein